MEPILLQATAGKVDNVMAAAIEAETAALRLVVI
jgi:hypothetical protein